MGVSYAVPLSPNSRSSLAERAGNGRLIFAAPLFMLFSRSILFFLCQLTAAGILALMRDPTPLASSARWWSVYQTAADLACLFFLFLFTRREGIRLIDLIGLRKSKLHVDVLLGLLTLAVLMIVGALGCGIAGYLVYGTFPPTVPAFGVRVLPVWAVFYSKTIYWIPQSFAEELTYHGFVLPRLQVLMKRTWMTVVLVAFGCALQHVFIGFQPDLRQILFMLLFPVPISIVLQCMYLRIRRLLPFILAHWVCDVMVVGWTLM